MLRRLIASMMKAAGGGGGADVAFISSAKGDNSSGGGTSFTVTIPAVNDGDFLQLVVIDRSGGSGDKPAITDNDGGTWTTQAEGAPTAGGWGVLATRFATGATSGKTITVSSLAATASGSAVLLVSRNVHASAPINVLRNAGLSSGTNTTTTVTPTYAGGMLVLGVGIRGNVTFSAQATANLGAFTEPANGDSASSAGSGAAVTMAYITGPALSASGSITWTPSSNSSSIVFVYELQKAP